MSAWKGGKPDRHKFSGRMAVLVRSAAEDSTLCAGQIKATADHVTSLSEYMMSGTVTLACMKTAEATAKAIGKSFGVVPVILPDCIADQPEAAFLQFMCAPEGGKGRDTVVMVAEEFTLLYWLLRSLNLAPNDVREKIASYTVAPASVTLVRIDGGGQMDVISVGDTGHLSMDSIPKLA